MKNKTKQVRISKELHQKLKILALSAGIGLSKLVEETLSDAMRGRANRLCTPPQKEEVIH